MSEERQTKLTGKQQAFVDFYISTANLNAAKAARLAGYKNPAVVGCQNLKKLNIRAAIDAELEAKAIPKNEVLARISMEARRQGTMSDFLRIDGNDVFIDLKLGAENEALDNLDYIKKAGVEVKLHNPEQSLFWLGKAYGIDGTLGTKEKPIHIEQSFLTQAQLNQSLREAIKAAEGEAAALPAGEQGEPNGEGEEDGEPGEQQRQGKCLRS